MMMSAVSSIALFYILLYSVFRKDFRTIGTERTYNFRRSVKILQESLEARKLGPPCVLVAIVQYAACLGNLVLGMGNVLQRLRSHPEPAAVTKVLKLATQ